MVRVYNFFQNGSFTDGTFPLGPLSEGGVITNIRAGHLVAATVNATGDIAVKNGATSLQNAVINMGAVSGPAANLSNKATLHATQTNRDVSEGAVLSVILANGLAVGGAKGIDTCVAVEVASET